MPRIDPLQWLYDILDTLFESYEIKLESEKGCDDDTQYETIAGPIYRINIYPQNITMIFGYHQRMFCRKGDYSKVYIAYVSKIGKEKFNSAGFRFDSIATKYDVAIKHTIKTALNKALEEAQKHYEEYKLNIEKNEKKYYNNIEVFKSSLARIEGEQKNG